MSYACKCCSDFPVLEYNDEQEAALESVIKTKKTVSFVVECPYCHTKHIAGGDYDDIYNPHGGVMLFTYGYTETEKVTHICNPIMVHNRELRYVFEEGQLSGYIESIK